MIIENQVYDNYTMFSELESGDVFIYENEVCMKTNGDGGDEANGVSLKNGHLMYFSENDEVRLVIANLTIR